MRTGLIQAVLLCGSNAVMLAQTPASPAASAPLDVRDVLAIRSFADRVQLDLSPDGKFVAFALQDPRQAARADERARYFTISGVPRAQVATDIHVTEVLTSQTRSITAGVRSSNWNPVWSPDGRT